MAGARLAAGRPVTSRHIWVWAPAALRPRYDGRTGSLAWRHRRGGLGRLGPDDEASEVFV